MEKKNKSYGGWIVLGIIIVLALWCVSSYNGLVSKQETVETAWSQVENVYQRRSDLIPNLVATVKGYADHEKSTLDAVISARAKATSITIDPSNITPEQLKAYQNAQGELSQALGKLLAVREAYPDLKANQNFLQLQDQLEGTENRISTERRRFNEVAKEYNTSIRVFPKNILANIFGFGKKPYFEAEEGANKAPKVEF